ncbi:MAG: hypothetical protein A2Y38_24710 [Spirochaetes bacterium GWB1_59_5]|nr:MAG: hypothetical protein A2Y38_24710 [Spirochaetes bacterium GWB1_59_5]
MPYKDKEYGLRRHREYMRKMYKNPLYMKKQRERVRAFKRRLKQEHALVLHEFRGYGCALCPEKEPCCLSAHHVDPNKKEFNVTLAYTWCINVERLRGELKKCVCLCENCHRKVHAGRVSLPRGLLAAG